MGVFKLTDDTNTNEEKVIVNTDAENKPAEQEVKNDIDNKEITLDGPLSTIYAKALNIAYAKEGVDNMLPVTDEEKQHKGVYVYCCNGDELDNNNLINSTNNLRLALDSKRFNKIVAVVECRNNVSDKVGLLDQFAHSLGIETIFTRSKAIDAINSLVNK